VTGELKIAGHSTYLHPVGDGRLIGVGTEAVRKGKVTGTKILSLYDTTKPGAERLARYDLEGAWSAMRGDPHAFLYWPDKDLVVMPVTGGGVAGQWGGALVLRLDGNTFRRQGAIAHMPDWQGAIPVKPRRALVIGDELWTVSEVGMMVNDLDSLDQLAWLPLDD
jgi:uncharacterized secreted protein with C-terminal beta-propeller domain